MNDNAEAVTDCLNSKLTQSKLKDLDDDMTSRIRGMIAGNITGDMLGLTNEAVKDPEPIKDIIGGGFMNMEAGDWTDDTSMLIALGESLNEKGVIDPENEIVHYKRWLLDGEYSARDKADGTGKTTEYAIRTGQAKADRLSNGNGALMRSCIITPYYLHLSDMRLAEASGESAKTTHGHPIAAFTNIIFNILLKKLILGSSLEEALEIVEDKYKGLIEDIEPIFRKPERYITTPYCVTSLQTAIYVARDAESFEDAMLTAVNLGGDADTIGAITGALAGAKFGFETIPERFLKYALSDRILKYEGINRFFK